MISLKYTLKNEKRKTLMFKLINYNVRGIDSNSQITIVIKIRYQSETHTF